MLAHKLVRALSQCRRDGSMDYLRPDGKSQVSIEYDNSRPVRVDTVVISTQHSPTVTNETLREEVTEKIVHKVVPKEMIDGKTRILINPTGRFVVGGPHGDAGVTGRKIIVDTYGGAAPHDLVVRALAALLLLDDLGAQVANVELGQAAAEAARAEDVGGRHADEHHFRR